MCRLRVANRNAGADCIQSTGAVLKKIAIMLKEQLHLFYVEENLKVSYFKILDTVSRFKKECLCPISL